MKNEISYKISITDPYVRMAAYKTFSILDIFFGFSIKVVDAMSSVIRFEFRYCFTSSSIMIKLDSRSGVV